MESEISKLVTQSIAPFASNSLEQYVECLSGAIACHPPVYGTADYGDLYRHLVRNIDWFVTSLVTNAEREGFGSRQIWRFSDLVEDSHIAAMVRQHSMDESRHSKMFVRLLDLCVPGAISEAVRPELNSFSPDYSPQRHPVLKTSGEYLDDMRIVDELIQINLVEIRSLILQRLLRPVVLAYQDGSQQAKVIKILDILLSDECRHIEYSARCIETLIPICGRRRVADMMVQRQDDLNLITREELDLKEFE